MQRNISTVFLTSIN